MIHCGIGCQPEQTTGIRFGGQSRSCSAEQGKGNTKRKSGSILPPPLPRCSHRARTKSMCVVVIRVIVGNFPAVKLPPWWAESVIWRFTAIFWLYRPPPKSLPPKNEKLPTAVWYYGRQITAILWFYRLRRSRYSQKTKNRLPPKNYRRRAMALPPQKYRHL